MRKFLIKISIDFARQSFIPTIKQIKIKGKLSTLVKNFTVELSFVQQNMLYHYLKRILFKKFKLFWTFTKLKMSWS